MNGAHRFLVFILIGAPCGSRKPSPGRAGGTQHSATLIASPGTPLVALRFVFRVGSQDDPKGKEGLAALTAAMVAEGGTKELTYDQILEKFYPMAAGLVGLVPQGSDRLRGRGPPRQPRRATTPLVTEMLTAPRFVRRGLRAAPQRGARLPDQDPPRRQRRGAGQVDPPARALQGPSLRPRRPRARSRA